MKTRVVTDKEKPTPKISQKKQAFLDAHKTDPKEKSKK